MPIYEYRCEACGEQLEKLQKLSDEPLEICPSCGKPELKKLQPKVEELMKTALPLSVPIEVESGTGDHWLEAH